jgi:predicted ATP-grasp superfamily ATP-dependent carboligase
MVISPEGLLSKEDSERLEALVKNSAADEETSELGVTAGAPQPEEEGVKVWGVGSTAVARQTLKQIDVKTFENGVIAGFAGVLLNEGVARDFDTITLLAEAHAEYPDARAAAAIMTVIDRMLLHVELDLQPLLEEAALIEDTLKEIQKKASTEDDSSKRKISYMYG